jgi:subfamily B ATP-binding cassette protein MsbA
MPHDSNGSSRPRRPARLRIVPLLRPHWKSLTIALVAVLGETLADVLQPWPIKIVVDNIVQSKKLPGWLGHVVSALFAGDKYGTLNFAVAAVAIIAIVGAISTYLEK